MDDDLDPGLADHVTRVVQGLAVGADHEGVGTGGQVGSDGVQDVHLGDDARGAEAGDDGRIRPGLAHRPERREALVFRDRGVSGVLGPPPSVDQHVSEQMIVRIFRGDVVRGLGGFECPAGRGDGGVIDRGLIDRGLEGALQAEVVVVDEPAVDEVGQRHERPAGPDFLDHGAGELVDLLVVQFAVARPSIVAGLVRRLAEGAGELGQRGPVSLRVGGLGQGLSA